MSTQYQWDDILAALITFYLRCHLQNLPNLFHNLITRTIKLYFLISASSYLDWNISRWVLVYSSLLNSIVDIHIKLRERSGQLYFEVKWFKSSKTPLVLLFEWIQFQSSISWNVCAMSWLWMHEMKKPQETTWSPTHINLNQGGTESLLTTSFLKRGFRGVKFNISSTELSRRQEVLLFQKFFNFP